MEAKVVTVEQPDEQTAIITLNRPEKRNALSIAMMEALCESLEKFASRPQSRVAILRGAGPAFCSGLDLDEAARPELAEQSAACVARTYQTLAEFPLVTIAAVHGAAYAGGVGLLACCDCVLAAADLRVCLPEVRRGLVAALATAALRSRLQKGNLLELLLTGEPIDAAQALWIGLVERLVPSAELMAVARGLATSICKGGPEAVRQTKRLVREFYAADFRQHIARALELHKQARLSPEAAEGLAAFHERREPLWPASIE